MQSTLYYLIHTLFARSLFHSCFREYFMSKKEKINRLKTRGIFLLSFIFSVLLVQFTSANVQDLVNSYSNDYDMREGGIEPPKALSHKISYEDLMLTRILANTGRLKSCAFDRFATPAFENLLRKV